jgi:ketosteroid isomerase-like protein
MYRSSLRSPQPFAVWIGASILVLAACTTPGPAARSDEESVRRFASHFLGTFENLDMPSFIECFADDASAFFPTPWPPLRLDGRAAIQARFEEVFAAIRDDAAGGPPYHTLRPENLSVQFVSEEAAIVSFHLRSETRASRRSLVLRRTKSGWRIVHLHASSIPAGR